MPTRPVSNIFQTCWFFDGLIPFFFPRFVDRLSRSLHVEYKHHGIDVQCQVSRSSPSYLLLVNTEPKTELNPLISWRKKDDKIFSWNAWLQLPLYIATRMTSRVASIEKSSVFVPSPEDYAEAAIRHIGYEARCMPFWSHSVQWLFTSLAPERFLHSWRLSLGLNRRAKTLTPQRSVRVSGSWRIYSHCHVDNACWGDLHIYSTTG